jgi:alginate O-acetyltransferase complex protein AlgI
VLFNSFQFLLVFLPASLALHWLVARHAPAWRLPMLIVLSVVFYGYWDWRFIPLLVLSILINWIVAELFVRFHRNVLIVVTIVANLLVLAAFKYANFFAGFIPGLELGSTGIFGVNVALPLGISFFTFHHIMYLVDLKAGIAPRFDVMRYALYICFFPQVLAGPLVRWREIMYQFDERPYQRPDAAERFGRGLILLVIGLAKKVLIGDRLALLVDPVFAAAAKGPVGILDAWQATLAFTFQIYFDFSGYTDMALGLALMLGIVLPQNFNAPYRAASLQDFWRRWHMTLSRFLRDYLYVPLGGNRHGFTVQLFALFATMTLGGLWHGAGFTFIAWGVMHGLGLCAGLLWRRAAWPMPAPLGWALTFLFVVLAWVLFRADSFDAALHIYQGLFGLAPRGTGTGWGLVAVSALIAVVGPTAWEAAHKTPPARIAAGAFAALAVVAMFRLADGGNRQFVYFQF